MTRGQALQKLLPIERLAGWSPGSGNAILSALEALGLLKFEEAPEDETFKAAGERLANMFVKVQEPIYSNGQGRLTLEGAYEVLDILRKSGYRLVKE